jgi:hypothetical protein
MKDTSKQSQEVKMLEPIHTQEFRCWQELFDLIDQIGVPDEFLHERHDNKPQERSLF